jgi:hypothetical protein
MPSLSTIERRRREVASGKNPRVTEHQIRLFFKHRSEHKSISVASELAGFSEATGKKLSTKYKDRGRARALPPEPKPYDSLRPRAQRACGDFAEFNRVYFPEYRTPAWAVEVAAELLEAYYSPEEEFIVFNAPPRAGKTTILYRFLVWVIARERALGREPRIQVGHKAEAKAKWYVRRIANILTRNLDLIEDFGRFKPDARGVGVPWSTEELLVEPLAWDRQVEKEPTVTAGSYEGSLLSGRYTLIVWDDLIDRGNTANVDQRNKLIDWWEQEAETRLEPGGLLVLSNARYGPEDLSHYCLTQQDEEELDESGAARPLYRRLAFRAHYEDRCDEIHATQYPEGCMLDLDRLSWRWLRRQMRNELRFRLVYQQEDTDPEGSLAEKAWFEGTEDSQKILRPGCFDRDRLFGQLPRRDDAARPLVSIVSLDPSASRFWAMGHYLVYPNGIYALVRGLRRPMRAPELLYRDVTGSYSGFLEDWWKQASAQGIPFRYFVIEQRGFQQWIMQYEFVTTWAANRGVALIPHDTNKTNKTDPDYGVQMLGPIIREGRLRLPYGGYEERLFSDQFRSEACAWPEAQTQDLVMQFWFAVHRMTGLVAAAMSEQSADEEDDEETPDWMKAGAPAWATRSLTGKDVPRFARERVA